MAKEGNVRDGRKALVYLASFGEPIKGATGKLEKGKIYNIKSIADTDSALTDDVATNVLGHFIYAIKDITLAEGDEVEPVTELFLGGATSKSLSFEKSTTDVTCDKDDSANKVTDGVVTTSGSIDAYDLPIKDLNAGINVIKNYFNDVGTYDETTGKFKLKKAETTKKSVLIFKWDARETEPGDIYCIDFVPCLITSYGHESSYGSAQNFNVSFDGCDSDDDGHQRSYQQLIFPEAA